MLMMIVMMECVVAASKCYKASNMCVLNPHVHILGDDAAVIAYTTLTQHLDKSVLICLRHSLDHRLRIRILRILKFPKMPEFLRILKLSILKFIKLILSH